MKLINYTEVDSNGNYKYEVSFNNVVTNIKHFNEFTQVLGKIRNKQFNLKTGGWLIEEDGLELFKALEDKLFPPKPTIKDKMHKLMSKNIKQVSGWEDIGIGMKLEPYVYQKQVVKFILDKHGDGDSHDTLIVAPCGSGKTPIIISSFLECSHAGLIKGPGMIVVKASLKTQWKKEIEKFSGLRAGVVKTYSDSVSRELAMIKSREKKMEKLEEVDPARKTLEKEIKDIKKIAKKKFEEQFKNIDLFILNYESLKDAKVSKAMLKINPEFVACDEIHYAKNDKSQRAKALYKFNDAKIKIGATATPVQRDPRDIFGIFKFVHDDIFPSKTAFDRDYLKFGYGFRVIGAKNEGKLNSEINPYMYILTKEEVAKHLPKLVVTQRYVEFTPKQQAVNDGFMQEVEELHEKQKVIANGLTETELKQNEDYLKLEAAITSRQTFLQELTLSEELLEASESDLAKQFITGDKSQKLELMKDVVAEIIDSGEKVCIFSRYARMQPIIAKAIHSVSELKNVNIAYIRGDLSSERRYEEAYTKFRDDDSYKVLICSDAGAEGINLSQCKYMIEMDLAVSYAIQTQRHGRLERADSVHDSVQVIQLLTEKSWDDIALKVVSKKEKYDQSIVHGN